MINALFTLIAIIFALNSNAALVDNGTYSTDDVNNIDYLHLDQTVGLSFFDLVYSDNSNYIANGWTLTSQTAIQAMSESDRIQINALSASTFIITDNSMFSGQFDGGDPFNYIIYDLWNQGTTHIPATNSNASAFTHFDSATVSLQRVSTGYDPTPPDPTTPDPIIPDPTTPDPIPGVPIPAASWLFGSALVGLVGFKRKK